MEVPTLKGIIIVYSYHHGNTRKIANVIGEELKWEVKTTEEISPEEVSDYELIGLGSGIDRGKHYKALMDFVEEMPSSQGEKIFIFSTAGISGKEKKKLKDHKALRDLLQKKNYKILDEFSCKGFDTVGPLRFFGGINKGRPNQEDFNKAIEFARNLKGSFER